MIYMIKLHDLKAISTNLPYLQGRHRCNNLYKLNATLQDGSRHKVYSRQRNDCNL